MNMGDEVQATSVTKIKGTPSEKESLKKVQSSTPMNLISDPDHYVIALKYKKSENFVELVMSHLTRFLDLPEDQLDALLTFLQNGNDNGNSYKSLGSLLKKSGWGFNKRKEEKTGMFGQPVTQESLSQIQRLMDFLTKYLEVEGIFRKPGNINRIQKLQAAMETGVCVDLEESKFHAHDVASILKTYIGDLPEPLLQDRYFDCHLQIADMMTFDENGKKTNICNKAKRIETLQLLLLLLPTQNRTLLRGILNLLHQTATLQDKNKMNACNLAKMFAPNLLWPRKLKASQIQNNIKKLNDHVAFMIRHAKKILVAPQYIRDEAKRLYKCSESGSHPHAEIIPFSVATPPTGAVKRTVSGRMDYNEATRANTETALKELVDYVQTMPQSAKKKKMVKNIEKHTKATTPKQKRHKRSRTFGGRLKHRVLSVTKSTVGSGTSNRLTANSDGKSKHDSPSFLHIPQPGSPTLASLKEHHSSHKSKRFNKFGSIRGSKLTEQLLPIPYPTKDVLETDV